MIKRAQKGNKYVLVDNKEKYSYKIEIKYFFNSYAKNI